MIGATNSIHPSFGSSLASPAITGATVDRADPGEFARVLEQAGQTDTDPRATLRTAASELVASTFIRPILSSIRESPFLEGTRFAPGAVEKRFGPLLDQHLGDHIATAANFNLVETIVNRYAPASVVDGTTG